MKRSSEQKWSNILDKLKRVFYLHFFEKVAICNYFESLQKQVNATLNEKSLMLLHSIVEAEYIPGPNSLNQFPKLKQVILLKKPESGHVTLHKI